MNPVVRVTAWKKTHFSRHLGSIVCILMAHSLNPLKEFETRKTTYRNIDFLTISFPFSLNIFFHFFPEENVFQFSTNSLFPQQKVSKGKNIANIVSVTIIPPFAVNLGWLLILFLFFLSLH